MLTRNIDNTVKTMVLSVELSSAYFPVILTADKFSNKLDLQFSRASYVNLYCLT